MLDVQEPIVDQTQVVFLEDHQELVDHLAEQPPDVAQATQDLAEQLEEVQAIQDQVQVDAVQAIQEAVVHLEVQHVQALEEVPVEVQVVALVDEEVDVLNSVSI